MSWKIDRKVLHVSVYCTDVNPAGSFSPCILSVLLSAYEDFIEKSRKIKLCFNFVNKYTIYENMDVTYVNMS